MEVVWVSLVVDIALGILLTWPKRCPAHMSTVKFMSCYHEWVRGHVISVLGTKTDHLTQLPRVLHN